MIHLPMTALNEPREVASELPLSRLLVASLGKTLRVARGAQHVSASRKILWKRVCIRQ